MKKARTVRGTRQFPISMRPTFTTATKGQEAEAEIEALRRDGVAALNGDEPQNGYYAFVAEKCAPNLRILRIFLL